MLFEYRSMFRCSQVILRVPSRVIFSGLGGKAGAICGCCAQECLGPHFVLLAFHIKRPLALFFAWGSVVPLVLDDCSLLSASSLSTEVFFVYVIMVAGMGGATYGCCASQCLGPQFFPLTVYIRKPLALLSAWGSVVPLGLDYCCLLSTSSLSIEFVSVYFIMVWGSGWSYMWLLCTAMPWATRCLLTLHIARPLALLSAWVRSYPWCWTTVACSALLANPPRSFLCINKSHGDGWSYMWLLCVAMPVATLCSGDSPH
jgi:hypothetical protein